MAAFITPFPYHIEGASKLSQATKLMLEHHVRHLIVMDNKEVMGVISEQELQHHTALFQIHPNDDLLVSDICSQPVIVADINDYLDKVLDAMVEKHLNSVVILREGELAGIFTTTDVCHHFSRFLAASYHPDVPPDIVA